MKLLSTALLTLVVSLCAHAQVNYDGMQVIRVGVGDEKQLQQLERIIAVLNLSTWTTVHRPNSYIDVQVPSSQIKAFQNAVQNFPTQMMHEDLGVSIKAESLLSAASITSVGQDWFDSYHTYDDHLQWLQEMAATFPNNSKVVTSGTSDAGRPITGLYIHGSHGPDTKMPAVIFHGTVHAREWITTMVTEYLAFSLLTNYSNSTEVRAFVDAYDFYIFPVVNPDGFVYSQITNRLWRKNRQNNTKSQCIGRDINRNWPSHWEVPGGASIDPCDETYKGEGPGDGTETKGLSTFLDSLAGSPAGAIMYIDWHSYSQLFMHPYGYSCSAVAAGDSELSQLGRGFASAVQSVNGTRFTTGPTCPTLYPATGCSIDYAYDVSKIKYSFVSELRDTGKFGFILPVNLIRPSGEEIWEGVKYLLKNIKGNEPPPPAPRSSASRWHGRPSAIPVLLLLGVLWILS